MESTIALKSIENHMSYFVILEEAYDDTEGYTYIFKMQLCPTLLFVSLGG